MMRRPRNKALAAGLALLAASGCVHQRGTGPTQAAAPPAPIAAASAPAPRQTAVAAPAPQDPVGSGSQPAPSSGPAPAAQHSAAAPPRTSPPPPQAKAASVGGQRASARTRTPQQPVTSTPVAASPVQTAAVPAAPAAPAVPSPAAPGRPAGPPPLDIAGLTQQLKDTHAIGLFTKLSLKNQMDDLLGAFRGFHAGRRPPTLPDLRERYDLLLMKVLSLLQDGDPPLASSIRASREALWGLLADPNQFRRLQNQ